MNCTELTQHRNH